MRKKLTCLLLAMVLCVTTIPAVKTEAAKKAYCDTLELNDTLELGKKQTFSGKGIYEEETFFKGKKEVDVNYIVSSKRKSVGKNYKVTYKINYELLQSPKLDRNKISYDDWYWGYIEPVECFKVFDYKTGKTLMSNNKQNVYVSSGKWNCKYYPKQYYKYTGDLADEYKAEETYLEFLKEASVSFTVTYPKKCKDVVVGIGFVNLAGLDGNYVFQGKNYLYNAGKTAYGKSNYYKKGKKTMSYMRLNK